ncbi:TlpA disulfide reductase family protein [Flavobacterium paronense]|uniref:TlpA family protein disulfide reductase n=1 Tax=Flavobacterium paronense TaxID=1392775 RepID=A0ABV5GE60_9FLAO|nr:TlpA disulfide reductase family protein [Flavobacterium paronense]MDN3678210.1 TlpA disulfide reductase family protein [Flavobacterium paronense]
MKNVFSLVFTLVFTTISFSQQKVLFHGKIENKNGASVFIKDNNTIIKEIKLNNEGAFNDTFETKEGMYQMFDGVEYADLYLKPGYDLDLKMDAANFDESITFSGNGAIENNFLAQSTLLDSKINFEALLKSNEEDFIKQTNEMKVSDLNRLEKAKFDANFVALQKKNNEAKMAELQQYYTMSQAKKKLNNVVAPNFDYENAVGGKTSLESLKGKYVYIDIWAIWCGPCRAEIPFLKELEKSLHEKNIAFVSISTDAEKDHEKWKTFVKDKELSGIQLYADRANMDFIKAFNVNTIPRFILIDPTGKVIDADAARPSNPELKEQLNSLLQ